MYNNFRVYGTGLLCVMGKLLPLPNHKSIDECSEASCHHDAGFCFLYVLSERASLAMLFNERNESEKKTNPDPHSPTKDRGHIKTSMQVESMRYCTR